MLQLPQTGRKYRSQPPEWIHELDLEERRKDLLRLFLKTCPFPHPKHEDWKYTPVNRWFKTPRQLPTSQGTDSRFKPLDGKILLKNGQVFIPEPLAHKLKVKEPPEPTVYPASFWFASLVRYTTPSHELTINESLPYPLVIEHAVDIPAALVLHHMKIHLHSEAKLVIIERFPATERDTLLITLTEVVANERSEVTWIRVMTGEYEQGTVLLDHPGAILNAGSQLKMFTIDISTTAHRSSPYVILRGNNSQAYVGGNILPEKEGAHTEHYVTVVHVGEHTMSRQEYRGIIADSRSCVFQGRIFVHSTAQKTDAYQSSKWIPAGKNARVVTRPQLEIFADDVRCTHGATEGDPFGEELFYMRMRGLSEQQAKFLLYQGFMKLPEFVRELSAGEELEAIQTETLKRLFYVN